MSLIIHTSLKTVCKYIDVEYLFTTIPVFDEIDKRLIEIIDKGTFVDRQTFIDRFGMSLWTDKLSTGCKGAICVNHIKDGIISLAEVGLNARIAILTNIASGEILMPPFEEAIDDSNCNIDIVYYDKHFTDVNSLNSYIKECW